MTILYTPPVIRLGQGAIGHVPEEMQRLGGRRAFVATSRGMAVRPACTALLAGLHDAAMRTTLWAHIPAEPGRTDLEAATAAAQEAAPDVVIGLGGGSAMDIAKLVAMLLCNEGPVDRYLGTGRVPRRGLPTIMIPTTAGSGSEVSQDAVLTDRQAGTKFAVKDPKLVPSCAIIDPLSTISCPPELTAVCGLDALTHAIEAYTGKRANPITDMYALQAIKQITLHLPVAVAQADDAEARLGLALGALWAGIAFSSTGTAAVHACGYPLSGIYGIAHGTANAMMLPHVVAFNAHVCAKYGDLNPIFSTDHLPEALRQFVGRVGLPVRLRDAGVERSAIPRLAAIAITDERHLSVNPRPVSQSDLEALFEQAW